MLRTILFASALGLTFLTSFQLGSQTSSKATTVAPLTVKVGLVPTAKACDPICHPLDTDCGC